MGPRTIAPGVLALAMGALFACSPDSAVSPPDDLTISANRGTGGASLEYQYFAGTPFSLADPDVAIARNGDRIEIKGEGLLTTHPKSVTGGGSFTHTDADGTLLGEGTWEAVRLVSFQSYGPSPSLDPTWEAGKAIFRVRLIPDGGGSALDATLWVGCVLPDGRDDDPVSAFEGSKLAVDGGPHFKRIIDPSLSLFVRQ